MATAEDILKIAKGLVGKNENDGSFKTIIDTYNKHKPLARSYAVKYTDEWCATTVSMIFIKAKAVDLIGGTECSVQHFIDIFKKKGIWQEDGRIMPKPGDIICYNWDDKTQPNDGWADHIGIVERVSGKNIIVIEGNMSGGRVGRRELPKGWGYVRGYACPKYAAKKKPTKKPAKKPTKSVQTVAKEVIEGKWGNGDRRKEKLKKAGYDFIEVQKEVNKILLGKKVEYYPKCKPNELSLVDGLRSIGVDASSAHLAIIAKANGITYYRGTANQNISLLNRLKAGTLKKA